MSWIKYTIYTHKNILIVIEDCTYYRLTFGACIQKFVFQFYLLFFFLFLLCQKKVVQFDDRIYFVQTNYCFIGLYNSSNFRYNKMNIFRH